MKQLPLSTDAQEWLDIIVECDGAEVPEGDWPTVEELVRAGRVDLSSARGPHKAWKRATLAEPSA